MKFDSDDSYETVVETAKQISGRDPYLDMRFPDGRPMVAYADLLQEAGLLIEVSPPMPPIEDMPPIPDMPPMPPHS